MMLLSILNLIIAIMLIIIVFKMEELKYRSILMGLFVLNLILVLANILVQ